MMIVRGHTANFIVSYDDTLANGIPLADAVLANCEQDLATLSSLFGGIMPAAASLPFQVNLIPGVGGAGHAGCLATAITCKASSSDTTGIPSLVAAEVAEVFMATQALGWDCGASNGEALSRVAASVLYPQLRWRWSTGNDWLNSTGASRPDWVSNTEPTDQDFVSIGCGSLFLNYLAYQLNYSWRDIIAAAAPTLAGTAMNLGVANAFANFSALLAQYYPPGVPVHLPDDDPFPLGRPGLYLRHNLADDGTSQTGSLSDSPDIIVRNNAVVNPQATFSTPASIASDTESDANVLDGQDNYVYLRVWNRGADAANVTATAYWAPPSTLVTPSMWNLIGSSQFVDVPPGNVVEVSTPGSTWPQAAIPAPGHYCFVATVGDAAEPAPAPGGFASFDAFEQYIYAHNNMTWRNFNVVANAPHGGRQPFVVLPFFIAGAWDKARTFALESIAALPPESRLLLQVPAWLGRGLQPARTEFDEDEDGDKDPKERRRLRLHPQGHQALGRVELPRDARESCCLLVHIPVEHRANPYEVALRQLHNGREVGRITWRLVPEG